MQKELIYSGLKELSVEFSSATVEKFLIYSKELLEWNKKVNLTSIKNEEEIITKHFLDSLSLALYTKELSGKTGIDIGTGAGFPGIPLKICFPDFKITLLDSSIKKIKFLEHIIKVLKLNNVNILYGRSEDLAKEQYREQFDIVLARALAELPVLIEICLPFAKIGGVFIAYKSDVADELKKSQKVLDIIGGKLQEAREVKIPFLEAKRNLIVISKEKTTPIEYPRKAGIPQKRPIYSDIL